MHRIKKNYLLYLLSLISYTAIGQFSGNNLLEYQYGQIPMDNSSFSSAYNRTLLNYNYSNFKAGITLENYYTPYSERNYTKITQGSLQYTSKWINVRLGSYQETIGRGILLRSFEIPGAILEDISYRSRNYFQRDIFGANATLKLKNSTTKFIYGKPLNNVFPPTQDASLRRTDEIMAIYSDYNFYGQTLGASVMNVNNSSGDQLLGMATISGELSPKVSYYFEGAKEIGEANFSDFSSTSTHAYYGNVNLNFENLSISLEAKDYNDFVIGSGINEPPALIKEHTYKTLNRSTHVAQPINESGYQIEAFYTLPNASIITFNHAIAVNDLGTKKFTFKEYLTEYSFAIHKKHDVKLFADYAIDPLKEEDNRISLGAYFDWKKSEKSNIKTEFEFQTFDRNGVSTQNYVMTLGYSWQSKWIFNIVNELSNDQFLTSKSNKFWIGSNLKYQINNKNSIVFFGGQRRGGPACNAGICYEVLDFEGVEIRWNFRF